MDMILSAAFLTSLVAGMAMSGVPLLLAGLGEQISEKAGVLIEDSAFASQITRRFADLLAAGNLRDFV